ncbi:uncharacterized protein LOC121237398 [Juglans microcarpa x Juglans regia]|uniref:uncharacterized protein LOC121237398 n=1 Tax=Juglans microcarpa x Juglans regia TaxID=2249226 RepID=UPI001B7E8F85|nr:uncharacterized protein LOC121237398 [Juglans microcarpa x Juglans regia]
MENRRQRSCSGEVFSFPSTPVEDEDSDFEFGSITPDSSFKNSPADHLFFNGRLLPHAFPIQPAASIAIEGSRKTSRTSSVSSKDSLRSSRSNSTNSRSSSCSSARTSTSDISERKLLYQYKVASKATMARDRHQAYNKALSAQIYGSSQRWQYITPVPLLSREDPLRRKKLAGKEAKPKKQVRERKGESLWHFTEFFWGIVSACKECHAMEPSSKLR